MPSKIQVVYILLLGKIINEKNDFQIKEKKI